MRIKCEWRSKNNDPEIFYVIGIKESQSGYDQVSRAYCVNEYGHITSLAISQLTVIDPDFLPKMQEPSDG